MDSLVQQLVYMHKVQDTGQDRTNMATNATQDVDFTIKRWCIDMGYHF